MVSMLSGKPLYTRSTPSLRSFLNVAFETVPKFVSLMDSFDCFSVEEELLIRLIVSIWMKNCITSGVSIFAAHTAGQYTFS